MQATTRPRALARLALPGFLIRSLVPDIRESIGVWLRRSGSIGCPVKDGGIRRWTILNMLS